MSLVLRFLLLGVGGVGVFALQAQSGANTFKVTPTSVAFSYTIGDKMPATQNLTIAGPAGVTALVTVNAGLWLTVSPLGGTVPVAAKVNANPTTLPVGTYSGTITVTPSAGSAVSVPVTLTVKAPPSDLTIAPKTLALAYTRGGAGVAPATVNLATTDAVIAFTAAVSGGAWLAVSPKSGAVFPGFGATTPLTLTITPGELAPGSYKATLTIATPLAKTKSQTVAVTLAVSPGVPVLSSLWPSRITQGAKDTTVTVQGDRFFTGSVVKAGTTDLKTTFAGSNVVSAVLPEALLKNPGDLSITVTNAGTGGGNSQPLTFTVRPTGPVLDAVVNAASYASDSVAPGQMVTIFGTGLGPDTLTTFAAPAAGATIASTLAGTRVLVDNTAAPIIYTSKEQVAAMIPYAAALRPNVSIQVEYNAVLSTAKSMLVRPSAPGVFTASGSGTGQIVAFNFDPSTQAYTPNTESTPAKRDDILIFYATGEGITSPPSLDGQIVSAVAQQSAPVTVEIADTTATILYAGGVPGMVAGLLQVNARVPEMAANKTARLVLTINGISSQAGATVAVK